MEIKPMLSRDAFEKNPDGSWTCIKSTDIKDGGSIIRLKPGMTFKKSQQPWGLNVCELLDQEDSN
jgi:hypothetical protein